MVTETSAQSDGNTAFLRAARAGHLDKVLEHLKSNIDINTSNSNGLNALHLASKDGHINVVTELLKRGAVVDAATKKGNTALHIASLAGQEEVVKLLVANGAAVNVQSQNGFTPLYMAAQENHDNVVRFLLANGANQSLATEDGFTPLAVAMQQGHDKVVAVLLENDTRGKVRLPALHIAAKKDDCKAAALLLQNDHNPDVTSKSGFTPLHIAAHYGNENIANLLLSRGADVNYAAKHNITPLHVAAKWGKSNMVSLLLEKGANIESKTRDGLTPLHCAARSGHELVVDTMLDRGAPISSKTKNGLAPLHMASQGDHVDAARILLYHRAPVDEVTVDYLTALHVAAHCGHVRVAKLLLDRKADPNARALNGFTPLHIACKKNRIKVVELLLKHGASIEATTESGLTPLHVASFMGCMNIVIYLLQHDASPDVPTVRGETPLHLAARANQTDIIRILLRNGAQVDARAREQQTPLHIASRLGNVDIVMLLLQHGAAVDSTTKDMYTALHIAGKEGQEEVASVLLEHGASLTATTKKGFTPLHLAAKYGNMKVAKLLLQRDAPVDAQGKNGVTPLHVASHYDHQNVALLLLDKGASPHAIAKNGHTPLHIAARKNQMDIATTLLEFGAKANAESKAGFTPLHLSSQEGHTDMSTLLIEHEADTNHKAKNGLTPLHLCAQEDRVNVAAILVKNGAEVDSTTKAGYTPLHVASHFGQINMVRFLLQHGANVTATTSIGYTPLHQAAQQGHTTIVNLLLENGAPPNMLTNQGQTALSIAQKLGYISVVETLKVVTEPVITTNVASLTEEKYRVVAPETMQETFMSDSEDEGGEDTMLSDQPYRYLTVDEMKSLGDDSLPIDVTRDERIDSNKESMAPPTAVDDTISPQHIKESYSQFTANYAPDNIDIARHPIHVGFLVSFLVDARGGAMRGCRHSGVRVIVPPRKAAMPTRVTCRYLKRDKLSHPPPLMEGEALASRILELGPVGAKFLGPVIIEVPHFGSLRGMEREIVILRSDNGETWREHTMEASEEAVHDVLNESFEGEELSALEETSSGRTTRILTTDFPQYFAIVSRIRQEVHAIGPEGGMVSSSVVPQVQAVFPQGALTKKIKVGLQAQPIAADLTAKLLGNRVAVSPIVTVEPRRRKFHKPITLTIPVPQAANKGMINQYSGDAPTLRLLCSITGGTTRAQWEDVTGSTPLTFVNDCVSFTTTVSARFWLMDCRNIGEATKMATELYKEAIHVPFMAKFVVFAKRVDVLEARLRVFCMTDDKEDKTLEHQEHFTEVAKSRDVEVLEGKSQFVEFAGNLVPVTKSGDQLQLGFRAFRENRLPFTVRVKDPHADTVGRILFMREPKVAKGEPPQQPICILNIVLPETILPESGISEPDLLMLQKKYSFLRDGGLARLDTYHRTNLRLSDISNLLGEDWVALANELDISTSDVNLIKSEYPSSVAQQAMAMLRFWLQQAGNKATGNTLEIALRKIGRDDIVQQCIFNVDEMERAVAKVQLDQSGFDTLKEEIGPSRDASLRRDASLDITYDEQDIMKESESVEELVQAEKKEPKTEDKHSPIVPKEASEKQAHDVDESEETKYIGEEKVVEEERRTVAQLKEIFAQDKRDRQYERQPTAFAEEVIHRRTSRISGDESPRPPSTVEDDTSRISSSTIDDSVSTIEDDTSKKPFSSPEKQSEGVTLFPKSLGSEAERRDSELFQGVSEGLVRLETTYKVIPAVEDILSPKLSKTPPPSPAEFKEATGVTTWQHGTVLSTEQPSSAPEWSGIPQEQRKASDMKDHLVEPPTRSMAKGAMGSSATSEKPNVIHMEMGQDFSGLTLQENQIKDAFITPLATETKLPVTEVGKVHEDPIKETAQNLSVTRQEHISDKIQKLDQTPAKLVQEATVDLRNAVQEITDVSAKGTLDKISGSPELALQRESPEKTAEVPKVSKVHEDSIKETAQNLSGIRQEHISDEIQKLDQTLAKLVQEPTVDLRRTVHEITEVSAKETIDKRSGSPELALQRESPEKSAEVPNVSKVHEDSIKETAQNLGGIRQEHISDEIQKLDQTLAKLVQEPTVDLRRTVQEITEVSAKETIDKRSGSPELALQRESPEKYAEVPKGPCIPSLVLDTVKIDDKIENRDIPDVRLCTDKKSITELDPERLEAEYSTKDTEQVYVGGKSDSVSEQDEIHHELLEERPVSTDQKNIIITQEITKELQDERASNTDPSYIAKAPHTDYVDGQHVRKEIDDYFGTGKSNVIEKKDIEEVDAEGSGITVSSSVEVTDTSNSEVDTSGGNFRYSGVDKDSDITLPYVTTPTSQRRGLSGGSQRLTRDQRPPPLDVSHLMLDDDDDDDDDARDESYIVTEPIDDKKSHVLYQTDYGIAHVNSSPDILREDSNPLMTERNAGQTVSQTSPKRRPIFHIESEDDDLLDFTRSTNVKERDSVEATEYINGKTALDIDNEIKKEELLLREKEEKTAFRQKELEKSLLQSEGDNVLSKEETEKDMKEENGDSLDLTGLISFSESMHPAGTDLEEVASENVDENGPEELRDGQTQDKQEKKLRRVERRFERMASETLESEAAEGTTTPEVEQRREAEFQRIISQLSTEEVANCQKEYSQLWDEGGLTPSEEWDSHDPDTPSCELDEHSAPNQAEPEDEATQSPHGTARSSIQTTERRVVDGDSTTAVITTTTTTTVPVPAQEIAVTEKGATDVEKESKAK